MALETETGSASATAESYCSVSAADAHHAARGITNWATLSTAEKEQALRRATDYMQQVYGPLWAGLRATSTQALDWPRSGVQRPEIYMGFWAPTEIPPAVVRGCAELALRAAAGELLGDQGREVVEQTVGPITTKYAQGSAQSKRYAAVDALLAPMMLAPRGAGVMRIVRA